MQLHLSDGSVLHGPVAMPTMGREILSFELDRGDVAELHGWGEEKAHDFLSVMHTRFSPKEKIMEEGDKVSFWKSHGDAPIHDCAVTKVWSGTMVNIETPEGVAHTSVPLKQTGMAGYYFSPKLRELSFGEKAVGLTSNPGSNMLVHAIKRQFADTIDMLDQARQLSPSPEVKRQLSVAITESQTAQMWAVKAVTWSH